jgi:2-oxoglutarate ferredoxin oxidoreductase subunit gamma
MDKIGTRIVFSGSGGQGIITAAIILAEAAAIHDGLNAVQTQSYGPEARGGATRADVIISDSPIRFPKVINPHILVCLTQEAYDKFARIIRPGGLLLTDTRFVKAVQKTDARQVDLDMYRTVIDKIGKPIVFNICMLGAFVELTGLVRMESIVKTIESKIPHDFLPMNRKVLELGMDLIRKR